MARVRAVRRPKKKPKTTIVSPDSVDHTESDNDDDHSSDESRDLSERLEFSTDDMRKVKLLVDSLTRADEVAVAVETAVNVTLIPSNNLFGTTQLYAVAKPIFLELQSKVKGVISAGESWGIFRTTQF